MRKCCLGVGWVSTLFEGYQDYYLSGNRRQPAPSAIWWSNRNLSLYSHERSRLIWPRPHLPSPHGGCAGEPPPASKMRSDRRRPPPGSDGDSSWRLPFMGLVSTNRRLPSFDSKAPTEYKWLVWTCSAWGGGQSEREVIACGAWGGCWPVYKES